MDNLYPVSQQPYIAYGNVRWPEGVRQLQNPNDESDSSANDKLLGLATDTDARPEANDQKLSMLKTEDGFQLPEHLWHGRQHGQHAQMRLYPHPQPSLMNSHQHPHLAIATTYQHPRWPVSHSGSSTPTPSYGVAEQFGHSGYAPPQTGFQYYQQDNPVSAISMSPQSSQGGWTSNTSSDGVEQLAMAQSPGFRPTSPTMVQRSDGIRKKNARFEIPKERNLANIDAMILASTDEIEKKELKQQKRLLRNRQAALDSRQRKKTHTEKLEQEKKVSEKKMYDLEEGYTRMESQLNIEREQWMQQQRQFEHALQALSYDRDEAIRSKTQETGDLRRQNNMLKECIRDLERQQHRSFALHPPNGLEGGFNEFDLDSSWQDDFELTDGNDFMDDHDHAPTQTTPKPIHVALQPQEPKSDTTFWNTFYMCLLFGAFIAANANTNKSTDTTASAIASSISPSDANNVLEAVLSCGSVIDGSMSAIQPQSSKTLTNFERPAHISPMAIGPQRTPVSNLDHLHQTLTTPSRRQEMAAAFAMDTSTYNHIIDPFNENNSEIINAQLPIPKPSRLEQTFANMQAEKDEMERVHGLSSRHRDRNLLWDQIPPQVVRDFEELVRRTRTTAHPGNAE